MTIEAAGTVHVDSGPLSSVAVSGSAVVPEFLVSLNSCKPTLSRSLSSSLGRAQAVQAILEQIVARLDGTLDDVWNGPDGSDPHWAPRAGMSPDEAQVVEADEAWARWCTELMLCTGYGSTKEYDASTFKDKRFFDSFWSDNPVVPVKMACQQLCTYALYSRGFSQSEVSSKNGSIVGVSSGPSGYLLKQCFETWTTSPFEATVAGSQGAMARHPQLGPGSVFTFHPGGSGQATGSHAAFVLRVLRRPADPNGLAVQLLDTGAVRNNGSTTRSPRRHVEKPWAAHAWTGGNYDNGLFDGVLGVQTGNPSRPVPFAGLGVAKHRDPKSILQGVERARRARPLGMARLVLLHRQESVTPQRPVVLSEVAYIGPRVWMHDTSSDRNYFVSRLLWSLRELPGFSDWQGVWVVEHPQFDLAEAAIKADRSKTLRELWASTATRRGKYSRFQLLVSDSDGRVRLPWRSKLKTATNENGETRLLPPEIEPCGTTGFEPLVGVLSNSTLSEGLQGATTGAQFTPPPYFAAW